MTETQIKEDDINDEHDDIKLDGRMHSSSPKRMGAETSKSWKEITLTGYVSLPLIFVFLFILCLPNMILMIGGSP